MQVPPKLWGELDILLPSFNLGPVLYIQVCNPRHCSVILLVSNVYFWTPVVLLVCFAEVFRRVSVADLGI